ncbi:hypothetical protein HJ590_11020 [Naumannella sp. ID2617S]|uniref:Uncharacterized protein n=1 Tax=Enemella dayhoffiae TaxID=2016507 RepID=A0A255HBE9_9ACTN|nr:hypothetical protein [Enemella dayhoffiae]NNG20093.1 hypothetical protein [Naumannella sp. ID2617S]OYO25300.1 hypothetical protein CGZ93_02340 [Enemella dayhoffiae]
MEEQSGYHGPFARVIGNEDLLRPTPSRLVWLGVGLAAAVLLGFVVGLTQPRRSQARRDAP